MADAFTPRAEKLRQDPVEGVVSILGSLYEEAVCANERLRFLTEATDLLSSSLDYETTLQNVVRAAAPALADLCVLEVVDGSGTRRLSYPHESPAIVALLGDTHASSIPAPALEGEGGGALPLEKSGFYPTIDDRWIQQAAKSPDHLARLTELELQSVLRVELTSHQETLGSLTLCFTAGSRQYTTSDLHLAEELARRAGIAIHNARLYRASQERHRLSEEANQAKDEFLGVVSHDLRTPLNAILGWSQLLRHDRVKDPATLEKGLTIIERNAMAQVKLIEDILDVSRIISGKLRIDLRILDLDAVLRAAVEVIRPAAGAKGINILVSTDPGTIVSGDPDRLQQVVLNLLSNAVKFTPEGGFVEVLLSRRTRSARIVVRDSGKGIEPAFLPYAFDRFRQADSSTTRRDGGLGLGLAIVRHVVELHGGSVLAESDGPGRGAVFTVKLPLHAESAYEREMTPRAPFEADSTLMSIRLDGIRILVVDDEPDAREMLATLLAVSGAEVEVVSSACEAIERLSTFSANALVSDVGMPVDDGYTLIRRIRASDAPYARIPALALTAYAGPADVHRAILAGFHAHLPKPIEPAVLIAVVANLVEDAPQAPQDLIDEGRH
jgi:signal transduction histidine kinase/ActR/RegA family two-component response regulator